MLLSNFFFSQTGFVTVSVDFLTTRPLLTLPLPPEAPLTLLWNGSAHMPRSPMGSPCRFRGGEGVPLFAVLRLD